MGGVPLDGLHSALPARQSLRAEALDVVVIVCRVIDLALAVASTTGIAVLLRLARQFDRNIEVVIAVNYVIAALLGFGLLIGTGGPISAEPATVLLALGGGPLWPGAFHLYAWGIATFGIARTGAWARLSLLLPVLLGLVLLGEAVSGRLLVGIVLLFVAFAALTPKSAPLNETGESTKARPQTLWYAAALIVVFGVIDAWISVFNEVGGGEDLLFFALLFATAATVSWVVLLARKVAVLREDVLTGIVLGVLNFGVSWFLLQALAGGFENRSAIAFTLFSAGSLVIMVAIGKVAWSERVRGRELVGVATAIVAIVALNL